MYTELRNDKNIQVAKEFPEEAFRYYNAGLVWLRSIGLCLEFGQQLSVAEEQVQRVFAGKPLNILEPQFFGLKAVGKTKTKNGETLVPSFPDMPCTPTLTIPGGLGVVTANNHSLYEELPIMGPVYQGCVERSATPNAQDYVSVFAPAGTTANTNLQGFARLVTARQDSLSFLERMGFSRDRRPPSIARTGLSYDITFPK